MTSGVVAVIPARFGSSRFPGKPLASVAGKPLIAHVCENVASALGVGNIIVATDDDRIVKAALAAGVRAVMTPHDCATGTDRVHAAVRDLDVRTVLNVQGDEPLVRPRDITEVLNAHAKNPSRIVNAMSPIRDEAEFLSRDVPKVVAAREGRLLYMSRSPIPSLPPVAGDPWGHRQVCIYAFSTEQLRRFAQSQRTPTERREDIEILRFLDLGLDVTMVEVSPVGPAVDRPDDIARVERVLDARSRGAIGEAALS